MSIMIPAAHLVRRIITRPPLGWAVLLAVFALSAAMSPPAWAERTELNPLVLSPTLETVPIAPAPRRPGTPLRLNGIAPSARHPSAAIDRSATGSMLNDSVIPQAQSLAVSARPSPANAVRFVKRLAEAALGVLSDQSLSDDQRDDRLRDLMRKGLNLHLIGKFALGPFWDSAETPMVHEYQKLFGEFVLATYSKHFGRRKVSSISFLGTRKAGRKDIVVQTRFDLAMGIGIPANWRVRTIGGQPQIIDVEIAGISMAMTYRNEFITFMERNGGQLDDLVGRLRERPT